MEVCALQVFSGPFKSSDETVHGVIYIATQKDQKNKFINWEFFTLNKFRVRNLKFATCENTNTIN